jgi:serine/threonine protein kinase
MQNGSLVAIK